jgi:hypothetical protein
MISGEIYVIRNTTLSGRRFIEGQARLIKRLGEEDTHREHWRVRFVGELGTGVCERWVNASDRVDSFA